MAEAMSRPGPMGTKNLLTFSPAATDLGLGDQLTEELNTQLAERKKRIMSASQPPASTPFFSGATIDLGLR